jgi:hypothetical protein
MLQKQPRSMPRSLTHALVVLVVLLGALLAHARAASAQELLGSAAASSAASRALALPDTLRAPVFATCASEGDCQDLHPYVIHMEVFPHWDFRVPLPEGFMLTNHNWTMEHDAVNLSVRQAIIGGTLRFQHGDAWWIELGAAGAEASISHPDAVDADGALAGNDVGRIGLAGLAGVGGWIPLGEHMELDLRLRGGVGVGEAGGGIYHVKLVVALAWD